LLRRLHDFFGRSVKYFVIVRFHPDSDAHFFVASGRHNLLLRS